MSVSGLCQVCERAEAEFGCEQCGALVCETHYDRELGFCTRCAARVRGGRGGPGDDESGPEPGGDVYR